MDTLLQEAARFETLGHLAAGVSHDFRNLLQVIVGNLYLLELIVGDDAAALERLQKARHAANRGSELVERLLALSRAEGQSEAVIDVRQVIGALTTLLEGTLGHKTTLEAVTTDHPVTVQASASQLESALVNLVINARDAMPHGGTIRIAARTTTLDGTTDARLQLESGDYAEISVADRDKARHVLTTVRRAVPDVKAVWLGSAVILADAAGVPVLHKPVTRAALAGALDLGVE